MVEKVCTGGHTDVLLYPAKKMQHLVTSGIDHEGTSQNLTSSKADPFLKPVMETKSASLNSDFKQKVAEILFKYSNGLWANALPKVYEDTYKVKFPEDALNNLDILSDICTVNQISDSPKKATLYAKPQKYMDENLNATDRVHIPEDLKITVEQECSQLMEKTKEQGPESIMVPPLIIPAEASPSVLVVELNNTNEVVIRLDKERILAPECFVSLPFCGKICVFHCKGKWARVEITSVHSSRALDVQFMDTGTVASVKVSELRDIPSQFLREIITLPPQAMKCCLADLPRNIGMWTPDAVLWLRDTVLNCPDCSIKLCADSWHSRPRSNCPMTMRFIKLRKGQSEVLVTSPLSADEIIVSSAFAKETRALQGDVISPLYDTGPRLFQERRKRNSRSVEPAKAQEFLTTKDIKNGPWWKKRSIVGWPGGNLVTNLGNVVFTGFWGSFHRLHSVLLDRYPGNVQISLIGFQMRNIKNALLPQPLPLPLPPLSLPLPPL
ncbi:unnamed protein product [Lepidochelys olivacea]